MIQRSRLVALGALAWAMALNSPGPAMAVEYPAIAPSYEMFAGFNLITSSDDEPRPSFGNDFSAAPLKGKRAGTVRAMEYETDDSSLLLGGKIEAFPLPQRFYLNADIEADDDWFGEVRHSYKDLYQFRLLSRRFVHNLDNVTLYDLDPNPATNEVSRLDIGKEYGITLDIDQFKMRLKTPNFPFHLYTEGEIVRREGERQQLFRGFAGSAPARVSQAMAVDQATKELTVGANSHLGFIEADLSHSWQNFGSDAEALYHYPAENIRAEGDYVHNQLPELVANKNTLKVHTTQTGQVFASTTLVDIDRKNEVDDFTDVEAKRRLAHSELMWTPRGNLSLGTKFRHRENSGSGPETIVSPYNGDMIATPQGVDGHSNNYLAFVRYSPIAKLTLKGQYGIERMERDEQSALAWSRAEKNDTDTLEIGAAWRARRDLKVNGKYIDKEVEVDRGDVLHIFNNEPQKTRQFTADVSYSPTARTSTLLSALLKKDTAHNLEALETFFEPFEPVTVSGHRAKDYAELWQRYLASLTHACTERFSMTATYVYSVIDTKRDMGIGFDIIDRDYGSKLAYHTLSLSNSFRATDRLTLEAVVNYTLSNGDYALDGAGLLLGSSLSIADISMTDTKELGVRLDGEYELGQGFKAGVVMRYVGIVDTSFDNPADGDMYGALFKMTKVFH